MQYFIKIIAKNTKEITESIKVEKSTELLKDNEIYKENKIQEILGLKTNIKNKTNNSGRIIIEYKNLEQFEYLANLLKKY